jgi:DNA-binding NarL/FixJ family response regulator
MLAMTGLPQYRILIVDDHKILRQGLRVLLEACSDFQVVGDADAPTALADALALQPTIVLMDVHLPRAEDGFALLAQLRQLLPAARVVVLTPTAADTALVYRALRAGAMGYVPKDSSDILTVEAAIRKVGQGQLYLSDAALLSLVTTLQDVGKPLPDTKAEVDQLTPRELGVLELVAMGYTNRQIAEQLIVAESTVRSHLHNILYKLQLTNRVQAASYSLRTRPNPTGSTTPLTWVGSDSRSTQRSAAVR